jgi:antitoxin component YwqK of YwqJK toxin-antitoxin module
MCFYVENRLHGASECFDDQGKLAKTILYKNDQIIHDA